MIATYAKISMILAEPVAVSAALVDGQGHDPVQDLCPVTVMSVSTQNLADFAKPRRASFATADSALPSAGANARLEHEGVPSFLFVFLFVFTNEPDAVQRTRNVSSLLTRARQVQPRKHSLPLRGSPRALKFWKTREICCVTCDLKMKYKGCW